MEITWERIAWFGPVIIIGVTFLLHTVRQFIIDARKFKKPKPPNNGLPH